MHKRTIAAALAIPTVGVAATLIPTTAEAGGPSNRFCLDQSAACVRTADGVTAVGNHLGSPDEPNTALEFFRGDRSIGRLDTAPAGNAGGCERGQYRAYVVRAAATTHEDFAQPPQVESRSATAVSYVVQDRAGWHAHTGLTSATAASQLGMHDACDLLDGSALIDRGERTMAVATSVAAQQPAAPTRDQAVAALQTPDEVAFFDTLATVEDK